METEQSKTLLYATSPDDPALVESRRRPELHDFLSEVNSYPHPLPAQLCFRIEAEGRLAGEASLKNIRWINRKAEILIYLLPEFQGRGYGRAALVELIRFSFGTLKFHRLEAEIYEYNLPAQRLFESAGFRAEGRLRQARLRGDRFFDILRYGMLEEEYRRKP